MKFNSQICTSREQSERLLALGLKEETADMKYPCTSEYYGGILTEGTSSLPIIIDTEDDDITEYDIPAWSLHRLIEMCDVYIKIYRLRVVLSNYEVFNEKETTYDNLIDCIEWLIKEGYFNKEYLEE